MKFFKEFKEFALKGSVLDMAIGIIIGGAFSTIINSLVEDVIMPFTALFTGKVDYSDWVVKVSSAELRIGSFITAIISFLILALAIFILFKVAMRINKRIEKANERIINKVKKKDGTVEEVVVEPETKVCPHCLSEVKFKATKCPHCTSDLEVEVKE